MTALTEKFSNLTDRYQTTVPGGVRRQLKLGKYCTEPSGRIYFEPVRVSGDDPGLSVFLDFLGADIKAHPERLQAFSGDLYDRHKVLVGYLAVGLDEPLSPDDE